MMVGRKAEKARQEIAWRESRIFARAFEKYMKENTGPKGKYEFFSKLGKKEKKWLLAACKKAKKHERTLFLKTLIHFMYYAGTEKSGYRNLYGIIKKMATNNGRLGEFYDYIVQYGNEKLKSGGIWLGSIVSAIRKHGKLEAEYYEWFNSEFNIPPEGGWVEYPVFFTTKTPKELREKRTHAKWNSLRKIFDSLYGLYVGSAVLGRIQEYIETGSMVKLTLENEKRAARLATLLFEFGLEDINQTSNTITLGLKETIYNARKQVIKGTAESSGIMEYPVISYLDYFKEQGIEEGYVKKIYDLIHSGMEVEAAEKMCRVILQECKKHYLIIGEKKYAFGKEGKKMIADFKRHVGGDGEASLLNVYDMITKEDYASALNRLRKIFDAIQVIKGEYPYMFS